MSILVSRLLRDRDLFERCVLMPFCALGILVLLVVLVLQRLGVIR
ncbi:MAG: hypothetical protein M0Z99_02005 [Betaproteobacteria bacterium]|nr:hypothetical protein [Betaproteobacteria bacterium]